MAMPQLDYDTDPRELDWDDLVALIAQFYAIAAEATGDDDDLSPAGYDRLCALQTEQERREFYAQRQRGDDDGLEYNDPRDPHGDFT